MEAEIKAVIQALPTNKSLGPDGFTVEFYKVFQAQLTQILHKLFKTIEGEATLPNWFHEANITLIKNPDKFKRKENQRTISFMNIDAKIINNILTKGKK